MASHGHHENELSDAPVENQAAVEDETGNDSDSVPTEHQVQANNHEIGHGFCESKSSEDNLCFSTTARWRQRAAWAKGLGESCEDLSLREKEEILQELDKVSSCHRAECESKLCVLRREFRTLIEEFYALSSSSVTGVEVEPQVEVGLHDSAVMIALKKELSALAKARVALQTNIAATEITGEALKIYFAHNHVKSALCGVIRGSNETYFTMGTLRSKQQEQASAESLDATRFESTRAPSPDPAEALLQNCASFKIEETPHVDGKKKP
jgi:hypothetical protein